MEGVIRNALAAVAIILSLSTTLGTAMIRMNNSIIALQEQVATLSLAVNDLRCAIKITRTCP